MRPSSRFSWTTWRGIVGFSLAFGMACIISGCAGAKPILPTPCLSIPPAILVEPVLQPRPGVDLHYKIEEGKEWFALDRSGVTYLREYILQLEGTILFTRDMIRESNKTQTNRPGDK